MIAAGAWLASVAGLFAYGVCAATAQPGWAVAAMMAGFAQILVVPICLVCQGVLD